MNKADLINAVHANIGGSRADVERAVSATISHLEAGIKSGDGVQLVGFGSFTTSQRAARTGRNPATGATIEIPAKVAIKFSAGKPLKEAVERALGTPAKGKAKKPK